MRRPTSAWTEQHTTVALLVGVVSAAALAGLLEPQPLPLWVGTAVVAAAVVSLAFDAFGGVIVGLSAAAALVAVRRTTGHWEPDVFWVVLVETAAIVAAGVVAGSTGTSLRRAGSDSTAPAGPAEAVHGSLGLLDHDVALIRLEEEVERARDHRRPLALMLLETEITDAGLGPDAREMAHRAVARIVESRLREDHVPFATAIDRIGAVMPETSTADAWQHVGGILDALGTARFMDRDAGSQRSLDGAVDIHVGLTSLGPSRSSADALFDAAVTALAQARADEGAPR